MPRLLVAFFGFGGWVCYALAASGYVWPQLRTWGGAAPAWVMVYNFALGVIGVAIAAFFLIATARHARVLA